MFLYPCPNMELCVNGDTGRCESDGGEQHRQTDASGTPAPAAHLSAACWPAHATLDTSAHFHMRDKGTTMHVQRFLALWCDHAMSTVDNR